MINAEKLDTSVLQVPDRQLTGYRNFTPMALKLAVAGAGFLAAAGGSALTASAQPLANATATVTTASVIASRLRPSQL
jgi:hypothetical protein